MNKLFEKGKEKLGEGIKGKPFVKYNARVNFESALKICKLYLPDGPNLRPSEKKSFNNIFELCQEYYILVNCKATTLIESYKKSHQLFNQKFGEGIGGGFTDAMKNLDINNININVMTILDNYIEALNEIRKDKKLKNTKDMDEVEAFILANIVKINFKKLCRNNYEYCLSLIATAEMKVKKKEVKDYDWFKEMLKLKKELEEKNKEKKENEDVETNRLKHLHIDEINELDKVLNNGKGGIKFINYILSKYPYDNYEEEKKKKVVYFDRLTTNLVSHLTTRYHPDIYKAKTEEQKLRKIFANEICSRLNSLNSYLTQG